MSKPCIGGHGGEPRLLDPDGDLVGMQVRDRAGRFRGTPACLRAFEFDSCELIRRTGQRRVYIEGLRPLKLAGCCAYPGSAACAADQGGRA